MRILAFYAITDFRYDMTAIKIRDDILDNTPNTKVKSKRNLSVALKRIRELGSKRNVKLFILFSFGLMYMEIYA